MKNKLAVLILLFCFAAFSACEDAENIAYHDFPEEEIRTPVPSPETEENIHIPPPETHENTPVPPPEQVKDDEETEVFPIQFSTLPPRHYNPPPVAVVPLTSTVVIYKKTIVGETVFIRRDGSRVQLPQGVSSYNAVYGGDDLGVVGYVLNVGAYPDITYMFMDTNGDFIFNFEHDSNADMSGNSVSYHSRHGYIVIHGEGWTANQGLVDMTTGQFVIEPQYDWLSLLPSLIYACKDGNFYFLDYSGEILFDLGDSSISMVSNNSHSGSIYDGYTFIIDTGELYEGRMDFPINDTPDEYRVGNLRIREERTDDEWLPRIMQLEDENGNIIIPFGTYDILEVHGSFVLGYPYGHYSIGADNIFDVLNTNGELLLHNPLGAIYEAYFPDAMVIWLDEETCILLERDGSRIVIENPPAVRLITQNG